jgi:hypothetical protein
VEAAAKRYAGFDDGTAPTAAATDGASSSAGVGSTLGRVGLTAALVLAGLVLVTGGVLQATGIRGRASQLVSKLTDGAVSV